MTRCFLVGLALVTVMAAFAQQPVLLTAKDQPGWYGPSPLFSGGDAAGKVPFATGALTDGNANYDSGVKPVSYCYWQGTGSGELLVDLQRMCQIDRVRVHLLNSGPHGTELVQVFLKGDPLEFPDNLRVGTIKPTVEGWNELHVGRLADGLKLTFTRQADRGYITLSEVEVWGTATSGTATAGGVQAPALQSPTRTNEGVTWWAFDFGPKDSPSFAQFYVADQNCVYNKQQGFGWIPYRDGKPVVDSNFGPGSASVPGLGERDRGAKAGSWIDALYRDFVMSCKYYHSQVRQTFALDVPNGKYRVMTMHGDIEYGHAGKQSFWIEAQGKKVATDIVLSNDLCGDCVFEVTVANGRLELTFDSNDPDPAACGFVLNGLVVVPETTPTEAAFAQKRVALVRAAIQRERDDYFTRTFHEVPYVETAKMVEPTAADRARGFIAWTPSWMTLIYPNTVPTAEGVKRAMTTFATPGEHEPVVVAVRALEALKGVTLEMGELKGPGGSVIPAAAWDLRTMKCVRQRLGSSWSTEFRVMPEELDPAAPFDMAADTTREFWLTLKIPDGARAGEYRGAVTVKAAGGAPWQTTMQLRVLPFKLVEAERAVGMYWRDEAVKGEMLDKQVRDMVAHGMRAVTVGTPPKISAVDGKLVVDVSPVRALLQRLRQLGLRRPVPYFQNFQSDIRRAAPGMDQDEGYIEVVRALEQVSNDPTALKLLYYPVDEIGNDDKGGQLANHLCGLVAKVPGATSYVTVNDYASGEKWGQTFDIWCGNVDYTPEQEQKLLASGKRYMRYGSSYCNNCRMSRNNCGFGFYKRPAEAMYFWHYQYPVGDPFNHLDGSSRDWCAVLPGPNGTLIPTIDWEAHREGIDDMRYVATLKQRAAEAKGEARTRALAELAAVLNTDDCITQTRWAEKLTNDEYDGLRGRLAQAIMELQR